MCADFQLVLFTVCARCVCAQVFMLNVPFIILTFFQIPSLIKCACIHFSALSILISSLMSLIQRCPIRMKQIKMQPNTIMCQMNQIKMQSNTIMCQQIPSNFNIMFRIMHQSFNQTIKQRSRQSFGLCFEQCSFSNKNHQCHSSSWYVYIHLHIQIYIYIHIYISIPDNATMFRIMFRTMFQTSNHTNKQTNIVSCGSASNCMRLVGPGVPPNSLHNALTCIACQTLYIYTRAHVSLSAASLCIRPARWCAAPHMTASSASIGI